MKRFLLLVLLAGPGHSKARARPGLLLLLLLLAGCGGREPPLPANLQRLDSHFYRSAQPTAAQAAALRQLGIRTVINLRYFDRDHDRRALAGEPLTLLNQPLLTWAIQPADIARVLRLIRERQRFGPVLLHCYHGADRTGLLSAYYRVIYQGWPPERARREMVAGGFGFHSLWRRLPELLNDEPVAQVRRLLDEAPARPPLKAPGINPPTPR